MSEKGERARAAIMEGLNKGYMVRVAFRLEAEGVVVPERFRGGEVLALDFGRNAPTPIMDLECTQEAISGTLRFGEGYRWCSVPWDAVVQVQLHGESTEESSAQRWTPTVIDGGKGGDHGPN